MSPEEQERNLYIVEQGIKTDFWKIISDQLRAKNFVDLQNIVDLHLEGKHEEAKILAVQVKARQEIIQEPTMIIRNVKPKFYDWKDGEWIRKVKQIFGRDTEKQNQTRRI